MNQETTLRGCCCFGVESVVRALHVGQMDSHSRRCKERILFVFMFLIYFCSQLCNLWWLGLGAMAMAAISCGVAVVKANVSVSKLRPAWFG